MRALAQRLLAASATTSDPHEHEAERVVKKLRITLIKFAGPDGFTSLLRRALALASAEVPALQSVKLSPDGRLEGLESLVANGPADEPAVAIATHLLALLVTFIGESLTLRLVGEAFPETSV